MAGSGIFIRTTSGRAPAEILRGWKKAGQVTAGDALYAGQRQRARILQRTERGLDVDGRRLAAYSTEGPYYHYPNGRAGNVGFSDKQKKASAARLLKRIKSEKPKGAGDVRLTRSGNGLRFESYAAFKRWLGRSGVDLRGARAPHMLQAIVVKVAGIISGQQDRAVSATSMPQPVSEMRIGIYDREAAERADGHNTGGGGLPKRRFFGASAADRKAIAADIRARVLARMAAK